MFAPTGLRAAVEVVKRAASGIDFDALHGDVAADLVRMFSECERAAAAGKTRAARRVEETNAYVASGHRDAAAWVASATGVPRAEAAGVLATARRLEDLPQTAEAFAAGELSAVQAGHIARAGAAAPESESELLALAAKDSVSALGERCRRIESMHSAAAEAERQERQRAQRMCSVRSRPDGTVSVWAILMGDEGARFLARHKRERDRVFRAAQRSGRREGSSQYDADALMAMVDGPLSDEAKKSSPKAAVNVIVDHSALVRGHRESGETCEIAGVGEVPVAQIKSMMADCILRTIVVDGADVKAASSPTRTIPWEVRAALELRDRRCAVPGCEERQPLENDHIQPFAEGGPSALHNLVRLCRWHHRLKTHKGFRLEGEPGNWRWVAPDGPSG